MSELFINNLYRLIPVTERPKETEYKRMQKKKNSRWFHGFGCCVFCSKDKSQKPRQSGKRSTDEVQIENKKKSVKAYMSLLVSVSFCVSRGICEGLITRPGETCRVCLMCVIKSNNNSVCIYNWRGRRNQTKINS